MARLYISKMKSEAKTLIQHCSQLESSQAENSKKLDEAENQLSACKLLVQQVCTFSTIKLSSLSLMLQLFNPLKGRDVSWLHLPSRSNLHVLISDIRALWRSALSARVPECQKLKHVG